MAEQRKLITDVLNTFFSKNTIAIGDNKPTTGTHVPGDIVIKSNPVADEAIGWICTAAGSPGTWVEFGANNGKLATARKITIGNSSKSFDGSSDISWSLSEIGAAASSHTHSYLPLSGGTLTGDVILTDDKKIQLSTNSDYTKAAIGVDSNTGDVYISNINSNWFRIKPDKTMSIGGSKVYTAFDKPTPEEIGAAPASHGTHLELGTTSTTAYRGDYGNTAYTHSQAAHAPSNAQKNSDITKAEIEAKLTGAITSHSHDTVAGLSFWYGTQEQYDAISSKSDTTIYMITN